MGVAIVTLSFFVYKEEERYGIMVLPFLAIIAAWALAEGARFVIDWLNINPTAARALAPIVLVLVFGLSLQGDLREAVRRSHPPAYTWLSAFKALASAPDDLVFTTEPRVAVFYLGRADYWARIQNYE